MMTAFDDDLTVTKTKYFAEQHIEKRLDILWRKQSELVINLPNPNNNSLINVLLLFGLMKNLVRVSCFV